MKSILPPPVSVSLRYEVGHQKDKQGKIIGKLFVESNDGKFSMYFVQFPDLIKRYSGSEGYLCLTGHSYHNKVEYTESKLKQLMKAGLKAMQHQTGWELIVNCD